MQCLSVSITLYNNVTSVQVGKYAVSVCLLNLIQQCLISAGGKICSVCLSPKPYTTMSHQCRWENMQCLSVSITLYNNVSSVQVGKYAVSVCLNNLIQ